MVSEAERPRQEDEAEAGETFAAGYTPTRSGTWVAELVIKKPAEITEA